LVARLLQKDIQSLACEDDVKRTVTALVVILLILAVMPRPAWAKSPTAKMTISGGALTSEIETTDPRILNGSNLWEGRFLDASQGVVKEPPSGLRTYEVWFYIKVADNSVRRRYVVYYSPNTAAGRGYIYLPGKGQPWYDLNVSAILRDRQDGKWSYAAPAWEELLKTVIAQAEAAAANSLP
jgi:hypothetical protein